MNIFRKILKTIKNSTVFLGVMENGSRRIIGTGFLVVIRGNYHLVTAKHVVQNDYQNLCVFMNTKHLNQVKIKPLNNGFNRISHENNDVDIAVLPFFLEADENVQFIDESLFLNNTKDVFELDGVVYTSFHPGLTELHKDGGVNPIIRKGVVSRVNNNKTFLIDGAAFPGNSGSPVYVYQTFDFDDAGMIIPKRIEIKLLGVMSASIPYQDTAISSQTRRPRITFEENTGLSLVHSTIYINEIIDSDQFQDQLNRIKVLNNMTAKSRENVKSIKDK